MNWTVDHFPEVEKDLQRLSNNQRKMVKKALTLPTPKGGRFLSN